MGKFENGIWIAVQFLACSHNETELAKQFGIKIDKKGTI